MSSLDTFSCSIFSPGTHSISFDTEYPMADEVADLPVIDLNEIEKNIEELLKNDPEKVKRVHDFFLKLQKAQPVLKIILAVLKMVN